MDKIKIAYVLNSTAPNSGDSKALMSLLEGLVQKDIQPVIVAPDAKGLYLSSKRLGMKVYVLKYKHSTYPNWYSIKDKFLFVPRILGRLFLNYYATKKLIHILKDEDVKLVHTNVSVINIGHRAAHQLGLPHIYHFREYADLIGYRHFPSKSSFLRSICTDSDFSICITKGIQQYHHLSSHRSKVIYDGVKKETKTMPVGIKENYYLYVGRIEPNKGLLHLLKAYAKAQASVSSSFPKIKVAGAFSDESYSLKIKSFIEENQMEGYVELLGERNDIDQLMQSALALVVPSLFEGFGFCMAEAMFNGCIFVGYNNSGTKEQFENGMQLTEHPIGFPYNSDEELCSLLVRLSTATNSELDPIRERAFRVVNELYSIENNVKEVYEFYKQINLLTS